MAGKKENIQALFSNTRSRVIILFTIALLLLTMAVGYYKFKAPSVSNIAGGSLSAGPGGIKSIPGSENPTAQYAYLQEKQNVEQAKKAAQSGASAIPTIVRSQSFGGGVEAIGPQGGKGALGFTALSHEDSSGPQLSLWIQQLKASNCSKKSVTAVLAQGAGLSDLKKVCNCAQLKDNGYPLNELQHVCSCVDLKAAGFNATQFKAAGYSVERLQLCGFDACEMKAAGFNAQQMKDGGFSDGELKGAGFPDSVIDSVNKLPPGVSEADVLKAGCQVDALKKLRSQGVSAGTIRQMSGCSAEQLKAAGYTAQQLKDAGFSAKQLKDAGFSAQQLKDAGLSPKQLEDAGFSAQQLADAGSPDGQLEDADLPDSVLGGVEKLPPGVSKADVLKAGCQVDALKKLRAQGVSAGSIRQISGCSAEQLKAAGYNAQQLKDAGFSAKQLKDAGFSAKQLKDAGFSAKQLKDAGFSAKQLKDAGFSAGQLKDAGFSAAQLKDAGFSAAQLKDAGFSAAQLKDAGFSAAQLKDAGFSDQDAGMDGAAGTTYGARIPSLPGGQTSQSAQAVANEQKLNEILNRQKAHMAGQQYQQKIQQRTGMMSSAANQALQGWKTGFTQVLVEGPTAQKERESAITSVSKSISATTAAGVIHGGPVLPPVIRAGDVLFAVLDTSVNSDEPGPILATIVAGKFKGAKLIGSFTLPANANKMVISFNMMSVPGADKTTSINAYAIDPNTARTALSSKTDHHYLARYGSLFAATFLEGLGNAFQSAGTTVTIGSSGATTSTTVSNGVGRSVLENAVIGLATLGKSWGQLAMNQVNLPITVDVYSGTGLGILFTKDVDAESV